MKKFILALCLLALPLSSHALFEVRAGYGTIDPGDNSYQGNSLGKMSGFNLDAIVEPPLITDLGFGLRYEKMKMDIGSGSKGELERVSALINYHIIDLFAYFGVIGTIGISNDFTMSGTLPNSGLDPKMNYTLGVEGGLSLGLIKVGAELGQFFGKVKYSGNPDIDLSGLYGKIIVGFGF